MLKNANVVVPCEFAAITVCRYELIINSEPEKLMFQSDTLLMFQYANTGFPLFG